MKVRRIDYSADEFLVGTRSLSDAECGVYWRACSLIYSHGGPIPIEELRRWCSSRKKDFDAIVDRLVDSGKLTRNQHELGQTRAQRELERSAARARAWRENGTKGGAKFNENNEVAEPSGSSEKNRAFNHQLSTINQEEEKHSLSRVPKDQRANGAENEGEGRIASGDGPHAASSGRRRAARLREDFEVPQEWLDDGAETRVKAGLPTVDLRPEATKFVNHFVGSGKPKVDWRRAWLNWCLNVIAGKGAKNGRANAVDNLIEGFGRAAGLEPTHRDHGDYWSSPGPLLDGKHAGIDAPGPGRRLV